MDSGVSGAADRGRGGNGTETTRKSPSPTDAPRPGLGSIAAMPTPDERLDAWRWLATPAADRLLAAADALVAAGTTPAGVAALRRDHPDAPVPEALELADARRRGGGKFAESRRLLLDRAGVEQATSDLVADWKAKRFGDRAVLDLCCGVGGDAMAFARRGPCIGVDLDPVRAFMCGANAGIETRVASVEQTAIGAPFVHLDPARRDEASGRRSWRLEDLRPDLEVIRRIVGQAEGGAVKLGPGLPLPAPQLHARQSVSVIAEHGRLVQAVIWSGTLARAAACEAVDLPSGRTLEGESSPWSSTSDGIGETIVEMHPAVERLGLGPAALTAELGADADRFAEIAAGLGLLSGPAASIDGVESTWFRAVRVLETLPTRLDRIESALRRVLDDLGPREIVVRTRGRAIDVDAWSRRLGGLARSVSVSTDGVVEVGGWRVGRRVIATIGVPMGPTDQSAP